jgi:hypothetical protein
MRKSSFIRNCGHTALVAAMVAMTGCDAQSLLSENKSADSSPPPDQPLPGSPDTSASPPPTVVPAAEPAEPAPLSALERAALLLPTPAAGMPRDVTHDHVVWRLMEVRDTIAYVAARISVVSIGIDEPAGLQIGELQNEVSFSYPVSALVIDSQLRMGADTLDPLPADVPVTFWALWLHPKQSHIGGIRQIAVARNGVNGLFTKPRLLPLDEPSPIGDAADTVSLLQAHCSTTSPGTAFWQRGADTGSIGVRFTTLSPDGGPFAGEFFDPGDPAAVKAFEGELVRDADAAILTGTLRTVQRSGIAGRATSGPSTWNLMLRGSTGEFSVQILGPELYGASRDNFILSLTPLPPPPDLRLTRE